MNVKIILFAIVMGVGIQLGPIVGAQEKTQPATQSWWEQARSYLPDVTGGIKRRWASMRSAAQVQEFAKEQEKKKEIKGAEEFYLMRLASDIKSQIVDNDLIYPTFSTKMNALLKANEVYFINSGFEKVLGSDRLKELQTQAYASAAQTLNSKRDKLSDEDKEFVQEKEKPIDEAMSSLTATCASSLNFTKKRECWEKNMSPEQRAAVALILRMDRQIEVGGKQLFPRGTMKTSASAFYKPIKEKEAEGITRRKNMTKQEW